MARGKRYRDLYARVDRERAYAPAEAVQLVKQLQSSRFTEAVECHVRTGLNVRHADEQLRGTLTFPNGLGKTVTVAVFAKGDAAREAQEAGADHVGDDDLAQRVQDGFTDFDVAIATPDMMPTVGRLGRILGPQGKMPNPKVGTVTPEVRRAVEEAKAGRVEYRTDRSAIVHVTIGRADFDAAALLENYAALIDELIRAKPAAAKGRYLRTITLATTMGPGIRVDPARTRDIIEEIKEEGAGEATAAAVEDAAEAAPVA
jgi:large subunit ribosomal protein L1